MQNPVGSAGARAGLLTGIVRNARLAWRLFRDPRVPNMTKLVIPGLAAAYLLFPADLLPDLFPFVGQLDDLAMIALGIKLFIDNCPQWLVQAYRDGTADRPNAAQTNKASRPGETVDGDYRIIE